MQPIEVTYRESISVPFCSEDVTEFLNEKIKNYFSWGSLGTFGVSLTLKILPNKSRGARTIKSQPCERRNIACLISKANDELDYLQEWQTVQRARIWRAKERLYERKLTCTRRSNSCVRTKNEKRLRREASFTTLLCFCFVFFFLCSQYFSFVCLYPNTWNRLRGNRLLEFAMCFLRCPPFLWRLQSELLAEQAKGLTSCDFVLPYILHPEIILEIVDFYCITK